MAYETMHKLKSNRVEKLTLMTFKLDISKVYDKVDWAFSSSGYKDNRV